MPVLLQIKEKLYIGVSNTIAIVNLSSGNYDLHPLPPITIPQNLSKGQEDLLKEHPEVTSISVSEDQTLLAVATHNKQVVVYNPQVMQVEQNFLTARAASKLCFDKENNIIVADKTGDAYLHKKNAEPVLLLGHLSMLLDVKISPCGDFIVTCDRDEKLRVSHYPNSYNILSYCLGHQEFVTNISFVDNQLISASGDGTIRLWNFKNGEEVIRIDTNKTLDDKAIDAFREDMNKNQVDVTAIPITDMQVYREEAGGALLAVTLFNQNSIEVYKVVGNTISYLQKVNVQGFIQYSLSENLIVLSKDKLITYDFNKVSGLFEVKSETDVFERLKEKLSTCKVSDDNVFVLYKRKFDNVQEYLERKRQRMENK